MKHHSSRQYILRLLRDDFPLERLISLVEIYAGCFGPTEDLAQQQRRRDEVFSTFPERADLITAIRRIERDYRETNMRAYKACGGNGTIPSIGYFLASICLARGINPEIDDLT